MDLELLFLNLGGEIASNIFLVVIFCGQVYNPFSSSSMTTNLWI